MLAYSLMHNVITVSFSNPVGHCGNQSGLRRIWVHLGLAGNHQAATKMRVQRFAIRKEGYFSILQSPERGWRGEGTVIREKIWKP